MHSGGKKKILLCWGYNRKGWVTPFEAIKNDFEFVYLFFRSPEEEDACYTNCEKIYWRDYSSGFDIIHKIQPRAVVLMSVHSGYPIALNAACKTMRIPTYIFQHGLYATYKEYKAIEKLKRKFTDRRSEEAAESKEVASGRKSLQFLWNSLTFGNRLQLPFLLVYFWLVRKKGQWSASYYVPLEIKKPTRYICFTPHNATIYKELDKVSEDRFLYTGVPELDPFFRDDSPIVQGNYYLLIDQPFADNKYHDLGVTKEQVNECYSKLNHFCKAQNARLVVKLHPENYKSAWLLQNENIEYRRDADMVALIKNAKGIFGTISTLLLPALYFKPCFLLLVYNYSFQKFIVQSGMAKGADFFRFEPKDISFHRSVAGEVKEHFIHRYLYKTDGRSVERLKQILLQS